MVGAGVAARGRLDDVTLESDDFPLLGQPHQRTAVGIGLAAGADGDNIRSAVRAFSPCRIVCRYCLGCPM